MPSSFFLKLRFSHGKDIPQELCTRVLILHGVMFYFPEALWKRLAPWHSRAKSSSLSSPRVLLAALESSEARIFPRVADVVPFLLSPRPLALVISFPLFVSTNRILCVSSRHRLLVIAVNGNFVVIIRIAPGWVGVVWMGKHRVFTLSRGTTRKSSREARATRARSL